MGKLDDLSMRCYVVVTALAATLISAPERRRDERGDVPGWVLVVVMTVGLVAAITAIARPQLSAILRRALGSVD